MCLTLDHSPFPAIMSLQSYSLFKNLPLKEMHVNNDAWMAGPTINAYNKKQTNQPLKFYLHILSEIDKI